MKRLIISCVVLALAAGCHMHGGDVRLYKNHYDILTGHSDGSMCVTDGKLFVLVDASGSIMNISNLRPVGESEDHSCDAAKLYGQLRSLAECRNGSGMRFYQLSPVVYPDAIARESVRMMLQDTLTTYDKREVSVRLPDIPDLDYALMVAQYEDVIVPFDYVLPVPRGQNFPRRHICITVRNR